MGQSRNIEFRLSYAGNSKGIGTPIVIDRATRMLHIPLPPKPAQKSIISYEYKAMDCEKIFEAPLSRTARTEHHCVRTLI